MISRLVDSCCSNCAFHTLIRLIGIRRSFSRLFNTDDTELAPVPGGEGVKQKSQTMQALERELTRHGLDLADVVDLFAHDVASEDEDEPTEQKESQLPTPELQAAQGVVKCAHGNPLGYVYTRDGSRRLVYEARIDEASTSLWRRMFGGVKVVLLRKRPKVGNPVVGCVVTDARGGFSPLRPLRPIVRGERGPVHPCSESLLAALRFLHKHSLALPVSFHK